MIANGQLATGEPRSRTQPRQLSDTFAIAAYHMLRWTLGKRDVSAFPDASDPRRTGTWRLDQSERGFAIFEAVTTSPAHDGAAHSETERQMFGVRHNDGATFVQVVECALAAIAVEDQRRAAGMATQAATRAPAGA